MNLHALAAIGGYFLGAASVLALWALCTAARRVPRETIHDVAARDERAFTAGMAAREGAKEAKL